MPNRVTGTKSRNTSHIYCCIRVLAKKEKIYILYELGNKMELGVRGGGGDCEPCSGFSWGAESLLNLLYLA